MISTLPQLVDRTAEQKPDREAIRFLQQSLSYEQLALRSNSLANVLISEGVKRHDRIGIFMDKSLHTPVAMYGIMKAGAAYVPLDPSAPTERLALILRDCNIRVLITDKSKNRKLQGLREQGISLDCLVGFDNNNDLSSRSISWDTVFAEDSNYVAGAKLIEKDLAYIIYTSGSTGIPKGIMHTHHSGLSFARWAAAEYGLESGDRLSNHAPLHFDLSIFDYFASAVAGASVVVIPEEYTKLPPSYSKLIADQRVSVLFTVPFALIQLLLYGILDDRNFDALRWIIFGGEPFPTPHLRELMKKLPHVRFDNMYGPAEVNGCTHYTVESLSQSDESVPIGPVNDISDALVVNPEGEEVARGESGELLIRGPTMMQGYWGRPDLNRRAFYRRQITDCYDEVYYRTGDMVVQDPNGSFRFLGRKDRQIKVRGYRVELDEVESALASIDDVEESAAFAVPQEDGSQQIQVAVTLKNGKQHKDSDLLAYLKLRLPWYALPSALRVQEVFPRTTTGKIDRRKLQEISLAGKD